MPGVPALRRLAFNVARRPSYTPCTLELRLFSRETVLTQIPMVLAMKLSEHFFCSNTLIVYLCSEVNCLYICNTKLINLREGDECSPPFLHCLSLPPGSSGASRPRPQGKPRGVFHMSNTTKILHFYLERAGGISADTFLNILSSAELPPIHILTFDSRRNFRRYFP